MSDDPRFPILTGRVSARAAGVRKELTRRAEQARDAAKSAEDERFAASLRGKAKAFDEAAALVRALERGKRLGRRTKRSDQ